MAAAPDDTIDAPTSESTRGVGEAVDVTDSAAQDTLGGLTTPAGLVHPEPVADPPRPPRHPGLDWLRVAATLGVLTLHAGIAYMSEPFPGLRWPTFDTPTVAADVLCWSTDAWVMPVFFLLGGTAAAGLFNRLGAKRMAWHRARRLGGPLLLATFTILPLCLYVFLFGMYFDGEIPLRKLRSLKLEGYDEGLHGPGHLWFLHYLLIYCLVGCVLAKLWRSLTSAKPREPGVLAIAIASVVLLAASIAAHWVKPRILMGFDHQPLPQPENLIFFATFFFAGWHLPSRLWPRAVSVFMLTVGAGCLYVAFPFIRDTYDGMRSIPAAVGFTLACWCFGMGSLQLARTIEKPLPPFVALMAAAAFWTYLLHHPIVGAMQVALKPLPIWSSIKFGLATAVGLGVSLGTYVLFVRGRWIGRVLGEKRPAAPGAA